MEPLSKFPDGHTFYNSDEFKALCQKFNIPWELGTRDITIHIPYEGVVTITQSYIVTKSNDTTTAHNKQYRTSSPMTPLDTPVCPHQS